MFLVIGDTAVARRVCATLSSRHGQSRVRHLVAPSDASLAQVLREPVAHASVLLHDDVAALRCALALAHLHPTLPVAVTVFDRTIAGQLQVLLPDAVVTSSAIAALPSLLGPCLGADVVAAFCDGEDLVKVHCRPKSEEFSERRVEIEKASVLRRAVKWSRFEFRNQDSGTRILLAGLLGLAGVLIADWTWLALGRETSAGDAFVEAVRVVATVGPGPEHGGLYGLFAAFAMLITIVFTAMFTAGLVDRFVEPRLIRLSGSGSVPRQGHVIVVGLGQVGFRLCEELKTQGIPVVAVERDRDAAGVALARQLRIPVVIGDGTSRRLLERVALKRCLAIAAVGSDDLDNVAVAVAVSALSSRTRVVLRAGEQEAVSETRSLLPLGVTRDVTAIGAAQILAQLENGPPCVRVIAHGDEVLVRETDGTFVPTPLSRRDECHHLAGPRGATAATFQATV